MSGGRMEVEHQGARGGGLSAQGSCGAQVGPSFVCNMELRGWHHGTEIHHLALTVAVRLDFDGYPRNRHHGWPHHFVPCLTGGDANSQLINIGDDMSGRAIVPLMVQHPGG